MSNDYLTRIRKLANEKISEKSSFQCLHENIFGKMPEHIIMPQRYKCKVNNFRVNMHTYINVCNSHTGKKILHAALQWLILIKNATVESF